MSDEIKWTIPCQLFGGPLDGAKYGDLPDLGGPFTNSSLTLPLGQPADEHPQAVYTCRGSAPVNGMWQFFYERTEYPLVDEATRALAALPGTPTATSLSGGSFEGPTQVALARGLAQLAHRGQLDRDGAPFDTHLARVAARFDPTVYPLAHAAAWLHDVGPRSRLSQADLEAAGIHHAILHVTALLIRDSGMGDQQYYDRILSSPLARAIKLADLDDRSRRERLDVVDTETRERLQRRYRRARRLLTPQKAGN
jgi:hypothetical protein